MEDDDWMKVYGHLVPIARMRWLALAWAVMEYQISLAWLTVVRSSTQRIEFGRKQMFLVFSG